MKNKLVLKFMRYVVMLMTTFILSAGCSTNPLVVDYTMQSTLITTSANTVYPNSEVPLKLEVKTGVKGEVEVEYVDCSLYGTLNVGGKDVRSGERFTHDFENALYMTFIPTTSAKFRQESISVENPYEGYFMQLDLRASPLQPCGPAPCRRRRPEQIAPGRKARPPHDRFRARR